MMDNLSSTFYQLSPLILTFVSLILVTVIRRLAYPGIDRRIFSILILVVGFTGFLTFAMRSSPDTQQAVIWDRPIVVASYAIFVLYYHFTLTYTNNRGQRGYLVAAYLVLVVAASLLRTDLIIERMTLEAYGYAPVPGPITYPLSLGALLLIGGGGYNLLRRYKASSSYEEKNRLIYLMLALLFPLVGGLLDGFTNLPPAANWSNLALCIVYSIAIVKYHLLDIRIIIRKSLTYILVSTMVAIPYVGILLFINQIFRTEIEPWWVHALIILLLAILLRPIYSWAQRLVDKLFYRDRYDYLRALRQFSQETQSIVNLGELGYTVVKLVGGALQISSVCLLLQSENKRGLAALSCTGLESLPSGVVLKNSSPIVKWLQRYGDILTSEQIDILPQLQGFSPQEKYELERMGARLYVPIKTQRGELSGILVLGEKFSQQLYSDEDRHLLTTVSNQMAMALENARLYKESQQEVAERKLAEEALQQSEERFRTLTESTSDWVWEVDDKGIYTYASPKVKDLLGYEPEEVIGKMPFDFMPPKEAKRVAEEFQTIVESQKPFVRLEKTNRHKDGRLVVLETSGVPFWNTDGQLCGYRGIDRDITERKQTQEQLQHSQLLASLGEMTAGIAHEVGNPLASILLYSELLMKNDLPPQVRKDLRVIHDEAKRAGKLMKDLLAHSRRVTPNMRRLDLNGILRKVLDMRQYEETVQNITVSTNLYSGPLRIWGDSSRLTQVFLNLILNAEEALQEHKGGNIKVTTQTDGEWARVSIADDGIGIPEKNLIQVFHPFFTTKKMGEGTGLGLSTCYGIVTGHGGLIRAENNEMGGATFTVEIPLAEAGAAKQKSHHE